MDEWSATIADMAAKLKCKHQHVEFVVYRAGRHRDIQSTCLDCRKVWCVTEAVADLAEPVSSEEQIELHRLLEADLSLKDLIT